MSPDWILLNGPPQGIALREYDRTTIHGNRTLVKYCRTDNPYAHYQRIIHPDGKEDWGKLRPPKDWLPISELPKGIELREHSSDQVRFPHGLRTVIGYHEANNITKWYQKIINPDGHQWNERRHLRDDEISSDFEWTGEVNRLSCACSSCQS